MSQENLNQSQSQAAQANNVNNKQYQLQQSNNNELAKQTPATTTTQTNLSKNEAAGLTCNGGAQNLATVTLNTNINNNNCNNSSNNESGDETEEENEVVEESPDGGRWSKRNQSVAQRDVPGIDKAYLAMDTENGYEVVWNEILLTGGKKFKNINNINSDEVGLFVFFVVENLFEI